MAGRGSGLHTDTGIGARDTLDRAVAGRSRQARGCTVRRGCSPTCAMTGWEVSEKTVADSMRRQGLVARRIKRRNGLTKQDKTAPKFPDLLSGTSPRPRRTPSGSVT